jgi:hypothetical protein
MKKSLLLVCLFVSFSVFADFDRNDPADLLALKTEVATDPIGMDYASVINVTAHLLSRLNDPAQNVGGENTSVDLTVDALFDAVDPADLDSPQVSQGERDLLLSLMARDLSLSLEHRRTQIRNWFRANSTTVANLDAMVRLLSRAEVLFGAGTTISKADWLAARDS